MSYLGRSAKLSLKAQEKVSFLATAGQTVKTGLSYTPSFIEVYVNGVLLTDTTDFTATNGSSVTFTVALLLNDEVTVISLKTFTVADHYNKTEADTLLAAKATNTALALKAPIASPSFTGTVSATGLDSSQKIVSGKTAGQYGSVAEFKAEGSGVKLRIDDNSNASATTRMHIQHNYNRDSGSETCDSSSVGQAAIKFDNGSITFATAAAGNTTAPTNRMSIDNAGIVTMPYQPAFSAGTTVNNWTGTTGAVLQFDYEVYDIGNNYNTSTRRFTAPVTGLYHFIIRFQRHSWEGDIDFRKNGSMVYREELRETSGNWESECYSYDIRLAASDYVDSVISGSQTVGTIMDGYNGNFYDSFSGHLIG
jgi:hypothetical protein